MSFFVKNNLFKTNQELKTSYIHLDFLRGVAALLVFSSHLRNIIFVKHGDIENGSMFLTVLYSMTGLGHQAVIIFFVLSGFFISNSVLRSIFQDKWSWKNYMVNRLSRLYTVLIPALLIGYILDYTGSQLLNYSFFSRSMESSVTLQRFLGSLFFLQGDKIPVFGSNDPLWSLSYEFWYYISFPIIMLVVLKRKNKLASFINILLTCLISLVIGNIIGMKILLYFFIWLIGNVILITPQIIIKNNAKKFIVSCVSVFLFVVSLGLSRLEIIKSVFIGDLLLAITFAFLVYSILHFRPNLCLDVKYKQFYFFISKKLASFSYTLYLTHFPFVIFSLAVLNYIGIERMQPTIGNLFIGVIVGCIILTISYLISLGTESHTDKIRNFFNKKLSKISPKEEVNTLKNIS